MSLDNGGPPGSAPVAPLPSLDDRDPSIFERKSTEILAAIRCFVDGLKEWSPPGVKGPVTTKKEKCPGSNDDGSLLMHLNSLGLIEQVQELQQKPWGISNAADSNMLRTSETSLGSLLQNQYGADERKQILRRIVLPLLESLEQCYEILDNLPQTHQTQSTGESPSKTQHQSKASKSRRKNTAPPPLGMLSLNDYTNVACLLEFAVSASLSPCLEYPHVYFPPLPQLAEKSQKNSPGLQMHTIDKRTTFMAQKRSQALPKSLAGRISKMALTWGTACAAENHDSMRKSLSAFIANYFHPDRDSSFLKDPFTLHQIFHIYKVFQAYNEMATLATTIGRVLLLDRFRPMLLPRHLSDVYLALLIAERLRWYLSRLDKYFPPDIDDSLLTAMIKAEKIAEERNSQRVDSLQKALLLSPLTFQSSLLSAAALSSPSGKSVDYRDAALAYRSLLGGGASMIMNDTSNPFIPPWLRLRLGQCLTKLAKEDLQSVVDVFVADARGPGTRDGDGKNGMNDDIMKGAAARLAHTLCAKPSSNPKSKSSHSKISFSIFQRQLCSEFVEFLVTEGEGLIEELKANTGFELGKSRSSMAMHLTLWATIAQLPMECMQSFFVEKLVSGLMPLKEGEGSERSQPNRLTVMQSIAAVAAWLFAVPSSLDPSTKKKVCLLLSKSLPSSNCHQLTILGQTLRLAASLSYKNGSTTESSLVVEVDEKGDGGHDVFVSLVGMSLAHMIHILVRIDTSETKIGQDQLASVALELLNAVSTNALDKEGYCFEHRVSESQDCLDMVYRATTHPAISENLPYLMRAIECRAKYLVAAIASLTSGISSDAKEVSDFSIQLLPSTMFQLVLYLHYTNDKNASSKSELSIGPLVVEDLLKCNGDELKIGATILLSCLCENSSPSSLLGISQDSNRPDTGVLKILGLIINSAAVHIEETTTANAEGGDSVELFSTTSIVLSLLIAVLELGPEKRSDSDESFFKSILPPLQVLSSGSIEREKIMMAPELAEMASHAMALIVAREEIENVDVIQKPEASVNLSRWEAIIKKLSQAERDLQSSQPPLRAKGVVSLRHIARSLTYRDSNLLELSPNGEDRNVLITDATNLSAKEETELISRLARICLNALADPESYVYLASIHTLVAISDVCPSEVLLLMGKVVVNGDLDSIDVAIVNSMPTSAGLTLSPEQRIKATEALIFMIRRRGEGISIYGSLLLETMLVCPNGDKGKHESKLSNEGNTLQLIQSQTHAYFADDTDGEPVESTHSNSDEKRIRFNTGGPVFSVEESDVLRAGAISVICELVSLLDPTIVAKYCYILVGLATDALQLEESRPVRRVAACLARELYACTMREVTAEDGASEECTSTMAVAIVNANEENLCASLSRCVSADELEVGIKTRLVDPATQSRSAEAIEIRLELKAMGVWQAAAAIAYCLEHESKDATVQAVLRALAGDAT